MDGGWLLGCDYQVEAVWVKRHDRSDEPRVEVELREMEYPKPEAT